MRRVETEHVSVLETDCHDVAVIPNLDIGVAHSDTMPREACEFAGRLRRVEKRIPGRGQVPEAA